MTDDYGSMMKTKIDCPCGCELYGVERKKLWAGETVGHVKNCKCKRCSGGRHRGRSRVQENKVAKKLGGQREPLSGGLSGIDVRVTSMLGDDIAWIEQTHNVALVRGIKSWWTGKGTTQKMSRITERGHMMGVPVAFGAWWDGKSQVYVLPAESFENLIQRIHDLEEQL